jgi:hypothetical protein
MERMTLREAAIKTARSVTTLRRHIRSGRLAADKIPGRYGPEYFVTDEQLAAASLETVPAAPPPDPAPRAIVKRAASDRALALDALMQSTVPLMLFQELQMKHEQLLVQYGMVRAGGLRVIEMQAELETRKRHLEDAQAENARVKDRLAREAGELRKRLREAELELEGRRLEAAALREKVRGLEMLTRNRVTNETIDRQFGDVLEQLRKVDRLTAEREIGDAGASSPWPWRAPQPDPEH